MKKVPRSIHWELRELSGSNQSPRLDLTPYPKKSKIEKCLRRFLRRKGLGCQATFWPIFAFSENLRHSADAVDQGLGELGLTFEYVAQPDVFFLEYLGFGT